MDTLRVAVAGASGYAGGEILRLLAAHPTLRPVTVTAHSQAGASLASAHPHLAALGDLTLQPTTAEVLAGHDVVFFGLPHGASGALTAQLQDMGDSALLVDCGADHRLTSKDAWAEFYGSEYQGAWTYGMPELPGQRAQLHKTRTIAVPGCNVTAITLALMPAVKAGLITAQQVSAVLAVGPSGAGKALKPHLLAAEIMGAASPYGVGGTHRHIPEIMQNLSILGADKPSLSFTPVLVPMSRGILATVTAPCSADVAEVRAAYEEAFAEEAFIQLLPEGSWPNTQSVLGSNSVHVNVTVDERAGQLVTICAIDNLGKGTAGAAIQSANLALGLTETLGLPTVGVAP